MQPGANLAPPVARMTLIGVGLIGGSFALELKRQGIVQEVVGVDTDADNLQRALERRVIDAAFTQFTEAALKSDVIVLAVPVAAVTPVLRDIAAHLPNEPVITDVGSTKASFQAASKAYLPNHYSRCVAAHPIAGSDRSGALAAQFELFRDKKCIVCPHDAQDANALALIERLWRAAGAQTVCMSAAEHDEIMAAVSHLPHLLAYSFMHQIAYSSERDTWLNFAGSGFRDFTRIAASHPQMWADICLANRSNLLHLLKLQQQELATLEALLHANDSGSLKQYFDDARNVRAAWK